LSVLVIIIYSPIGLPIFVGTSIVAFDD